jgi:hypothetical protein
LSRLAALRSRGEIKRLGAEADQDASLRLVLVGEAARRGVLEPGSLPGKKLVRALLERAAGAQVRANPIHVDEAFTCGHCGRDVVAGGRPVRDHCPHCLRSLHVDVVPGDRAAGCGGFLDPVRFELDHGQVVIHYCCRRCGYAWRGRSHPDDALPPSLNPSDLTGSGI